MLCLVYIPVSYQGKDSAAKRSKLELMCGFQSQKIHIPKGMNGIFPGLHYSNAIIMSISEETQHFQIEMAAKNLTSVLLFFKNPSSIKTLFDFIGLLTK